MSSPDELLPVTQADRDAAAALLACDLGEPLSPADHFHLGSIQSGQADDDDGVQAFARHRMSHSLPGDVGMAKLRGLSERAAPSPWVVYSEPDVGLFASIFSGTVMETGFAPSKASGSPIQTPTSIHTMLDTAPRAPPKQGEQHSSFNRREGDNTADQPRKPPLIGGKGIETMTKREIASLAKKVDDLTAKVGKRRDELRKLLGDFDALFESCEAAGEELDDAVGYLQDAKRALDYAADQMSQQA